MHSTEVEEQLQRILCKELSKREALRLISNLYTQEELEYKTYRETIRFINLTY